MKHRFYRAMVGFIVLAPGLALAGGDESQSSGVLEKLRSISVNNSAVEFVAKTNGCTQTDDFSILIEHGELSVLRHREDLCRKMPKWVPFKLPHHYAGSQPEIVIKNPLQFDMQSKRLR